MASNSKKPRVKPPKSRPISTAPISQPVTADAAALAALAAFSPKGEYFAFLSQAVDRHRLRVYDTTSGNSIAENIFEAARVTALIWAELDLSQGASVEGEPASPSKKKKKKESLSATTTNTGVSQAVQVIALGLSDGSVSFFSPIHGRILRTLSHPSSTSSILAIIIDSETVWTSSEDGAIRAWTTSSPSKILGTWKTADRIPYTSLALRPGISEKEQGQTQILAANHSIRLLSASASSSPSTDSQSPQELCTFTGHASSVTSLQWEVPTSGPASRFVSIAEDDRFASVWLVPDNLAGGSIEGKMIASITSDSTIRHISISPKESTLLSLSATGKLSLFALPDDVTTTSSKKSKSKVATLTPRSTISISVTSGKKNDASDAEIAAATFLQGDAGRIRVARIVGGVRPAFDTIRYLDDTGDYVPEINISHKEEGSGPLAPASALSDPSLNNRRYKEGPSLTVRSGVELGQEAALDDLPMRDIEGELDVNLAELSLGQRLKGVSGHDADEPSAESSEDDENGQVASKPAKRKRGDQPGIPANSLTATLIQALHSSDSRLLETCLSHSEQNLIRNTVRRLPAQLAVPLLMACVERLGRGGRVGTGKGGGGGASSQRGTTLVRWIKAVLIVHSGHLMTMPDLVARLSGLHATLTTRLSLQERLLSLSGRLDLVLSQIEMRSSTAPAPLAPQKVAKKDTKSRSQGRKYVEGESSSEEEEDIMGDSAAMEVESADEEGSVEDVELGGESDEDDSAEEQEGSDEEDDGSDDDYGPKVNGFLDMEAQEDDDDEEEEDDDYSE